MLAFITTRSRIRFAIRTRGDFMLRYGAGSRDPGSMAPLRFIPAFGRFPEA